MFPKVFSELLALLDTLWEIKEFSGQMSLANAMCAIPVQCTISTLKTEKFCSKRMSTCIFQTFLTQICFAPVNILSCWCCSERRMENAGQVPIIHRGRAYGPRKKEHSRAVKLFQILCQAEECACDWLWLCFLVYLLKTLLHCYKRVFLFLFF